jgi:hypothetical protein
MSNPEYSPGHYPDRQPHIEILYPHDFYAAYIFDRATSREQDVVRVIEHAFTLGYPLRFWWLSQAIDLMGSPDRLLVCVHHPGGSEEAGMDLYQALKDEGIEWDDLEAAAMDEYLFLGTTIRSQMEITTPDGKPLFSEVP